MNDFRFLHAADIHLDSPLIGLGKFEEASAEQIQAASREALENLVQFARDESVDFVVIAGDLYDGNWKDYSTGLYFNRQMGRLNQAKIPVFILKGNHDAASQITKSLQLPDNVRVFDHKKPQSLEVEGLDVVLHGQSFPKQHVHDNLVPDYPIPVKGVVNIGVLHTGLEGGTIHVDYAPCKLGELVTKGYDYWALGHVHEHKILNEDPYVVYPGNLQGRNIREVGPKGACLITVEGGAVASVEHVPMDVARWAELRVDVAGAEAFDQVTEAMAKTIEEAVEEQADGRLLACRIVLGGASAMDGSLRARIPELRAEATAATFRRGEPEAWIEKVRVETVSPVSMDELIERADLLAEVLESIPDALEDDEFIQSLNTTLQAFWAALPADVKENVDDPLLRAVAENDFAALLQGVRTEIAAELTRAGAE